MDILENIKGDLNNHYHDNIIYFLNENETDKYKKIKELLSKDYGYLDIVLSFEDYDKLMPLFKKLKDDDRKLLIYRINNDYINYCILKGAGIENIDYGISVSEIGEHLFKNDISEYIKCENLFFNFDVYDPIINKAKETENKKCRIHFLLDNVKNKDLQRCINDFIAYRCDIAMMCYTTNDLLTTYTTNNNIIQNVHDYIRIESEEKAKVLRKKWEGNVI